jgi:hypothetical protein
MFNYSKKIKIISLVILAVLVGLIIFMVYFNNNRSDDIVVFTQSKELAVALEKYYDKFNEYPELEKTRTNLLTKLTDNGFNQEGDIIYWQGGYEWARGASYTSDSNNYTIIFRINNKWPMWGINTYNGGICTIATNLSISCVQSF